MVRRYLGLKGVRVMINNRSQECVCVCIINSVSGAPWHMEGKWGSRYALSLCVFRDNICVAKCGDSRPSAARRGAARCSYLARGGGLQCHRRYRSSREKISRWSQSAHPCTTVFCFLAPWWRGKSSCAAQRWRHCLQ